MSQGNNRYNEVISSDLFLYLDTIVVDDDDFIQYILSFLLQYGNAMKQPTDPKILYRADITKKNPAPFAGSPWKQFCELSYKCLSKLQKPIRTPSLTAFFPKIVFRLDKCS